MVYLLTILKLDMWPTFWSIHWRFECVICDEKNQSELATWQIVIGPRGATKINDAAATACATSSSYVANTVGFHANVPFWRKKIVIACTNAVNGAVKTPGRRTIVTKKGLYPWPNPIVIECNHFCDDNLFVIEWKQINDEKFKFVTHCQMWRDLSDHVNFVTTSS